jgi:hypothetical protein
MPSRRIRVPRPRWYWIPARILLVTLVLTGLAFAVSLLLGILGLALGARLRGVPADMTLAYRGIAIPAAAMSGTVVLISSIALEVRHYRQSKTLAAIERSS